jgi:predicted glycoside hydrolase/deacetylase ChbG (UPF0249 family)
MILVVNADDAGVDIERNRGILRVAREGLVRSASVLVTFGAARDFAQEARQLEAASGPPLGLGLHANFTEGPPLVKGHRSLVGANGLFLGKRALMKRGEAGLIDEREAARELEAQWEALARLGAKPTHLDGHNHAHLCPGIAEAVLKVVPPGAWVRLGASRAAVRSPRKPLELELPADPYSSREALLSFLERLAARAWELGWDRYRSAARFEGLSLPPGYMAEDLMALLSSLAGADGEVVELMTHPGELSRSSVRFSSSPDRAREADALSDPRLLGLLKERGLRLSSFGALE